MSIELLGTVTVDSGVFGFDLASIAGRPDVSVPALLLSDLKGRCSSSNGLGVSQPDTPPLNATIVRRDMRCQADVESLFVALHRRMDVDDATTVVDPISCSIVVVTSAYDAAVAGTTAPIQSR